MPEPVSPRSRSRAGECDIGGGADVGQRSRTLLTEWLTQNAAVVGKRYASEVSRHYHSPARSSDHSG